VALVLLVYRCVLAGLVSLLVTMTGAMPLVLDVVLGATDASHRAAVRAPPVDLFGGER
jgi:hypothetical protein